MRSRPFRKDIFDLKELIRSVSSDDGEPEALGAFSKRSLQDTALQLRWVSREAPHFPARLFCCREDGGKKVEKNWQEVADEEMEKNIFNGLITVITID